MQNSETNSANSASQPPDTASNGNNPTRTRANRRIDAATISEIARLCARQLSESEACRKIGIRPQAWFSWKSRHNRSEKFAALLEEFRAGRIDSLITKIESAADGVNMKQPDWRAAAALLKFADMKRFGDAPTADFNPATVDSIAKIGGEAAVMKLINHYAEHAKQRALPAPAQGEVAATIEVSTEKLTPYLPSI